MQLREIQASWNALVPFAVARGIDVQVWRVPPQTRDRGMRRLNKLRGLLGIVIPPEQSQFQHNPGVALPPIRDIVAQYNALIPRATALGIRNARPWTSLPSTSLRGMQRLQWLRRQLGEAITIDLRDQVTIPDATAAAMTDGTDFDAFTFGIEIECMLPRGGSKQVLHNDFIRAGLACCIEPYNHTTRAHWKITTDGSLGDYTLGIEVISPVLHGAVGFAQLRKVCAVLAAYKCKANSKCGLHVHVGWKEGNQLWDAPTLRQILNLYTHYEKVIDSMLLESRRGFAAGRGFCDSTTLSTNQRDLDLAQTWQQVCKAIGQNPEPRTIRAADRHKKINMKTIGVYGTVEFRHYHGTVAMKEVEYWLRFVLRLVMAARLGATPAHLGATFDTLQQIIRLDASEAQHFQKQIAWLRPLAPTRLVER